MHIHICVFPTSINSIIQKLLPNKKLYGEYLDLLKIIILKFRHQCMHCGGQLWCRSGSKQTSVAEAMSSSHTVESL